MSRVKQLQEMNEAVQSFYETWVNYIESEMNNNADHSPLNEYAIPDEEQKPQTVSFEAIQKHLAEKARQGFSNQIRDLIQSYDVNKLSDIKPEDYPKIWKQVDELE